MTAFPAKFVNSSKKIHKCEMCLREIPIGAGYIIYPCKPIGENKIQNIPICIECAYVWTHYRGKSKAIRTGGFTEQLIPNCLRKIRNEFRKNPVEHLKNFSLTEEE